MAERPDQPASPPPPSGGVPPGEEPTTSGTLFVMILFLMALAGMWVLMYLRLLEV